MLKCINISELQKTCNKVLTVRIKGIKNPKLYTKNHFSIKQFFWTIWL